ncbi:PREDICTED: poly [ADP-ribose] polymerase-like [Wasmannia auropunctata]|uniref:poly [ADP-ribose] polymerase-like n=1 Tax=Wasmannia auropunctata TaxID=64793 RepID=UPI0005EDDF6C|nr:PREDICTED: poly [ADP-ribose] polymerase-like [Wasmannia auropunctata]
MSNDLPYLVEYAKSDRSKCQLCKQQIRMQSLRLAAVVQSPVHDGKIPKWYHFKCFFTKQRPKSTDDIARFDEIRNTDQDAIRKKLEESQKAPAAQPKGKKRTKGGKGSGDFRVEYAKSSRSTCIGCQEKIVKGETRIAKKDYETEEARRFGGMDRWHHVECFAKLRADLGYYGRGDELPGAAELSKEDLESLKASLPKMNQGDIPPPPKKIKDEPEDAEEEKLMKKQNEQLYAIKDKISCLEKKEMMELLAENNQEVPSGVSNITSLLSDILCFGALQPCPKCKGQLIYKSGVGYKCTGNVTEWAKCEYVTQDPKRKKCEIPSDMKEDFPIKSYKSKVKKRIFKVTMPSSSSSVKKEEDEADGPKVQGKPRPLKNMQFVILGKTQKDKEELKKEISLLGGTVTTKIHQDLAAVISNQAEVDKMNKRMEDVQAHDIQVITEDFVEEAKEYTDAPVMLLKKKTISSWGGDVNARLSNVIAKSASKSKSRFEKSVSGKVKVKVKGGGAVDPDSGLDDLAHIYQRGKDKYTVTLGLTDIQSKKNSYYKMQILKHDHRETYHLFRSWGRIGTTIGGNKLERMSLEECIEQFESLYEEKTGNEWKNREHFVKVPNCMYPIDIDHGDQEVASLDSDIKSNLQKPIQDLMRLIFDVAEMKKVMLEFEIDMEKMPLGKLSKKQIDKAYAVLTQLQEILKKSNVDRTALIDASNRFYTLIPHNFGVSGPKILESPEEIRAKCDMLDALLEMEIAYNLLSSDKTNEKENPLDVHYKQLKTNIDVLDKTSEEFKMIEKYVKNTHAATHTQYDLEIAEVFVVRRNGEEQRYKPFKKLPNRKLLWHGSRTTNYAGILSQGLRIAPPEAPVTGYMFGKGIYFADMVSKSANYCCTHSQNPTGLLLLCEVALGNIYERYQADYIEKLPKGKHSTMGRGQTHPDPKDVHKTEDGIEVPYGMGVPAKLSKNSALLYNEYIVYDVAQVKVRYMIRMNFKYKY